MNKKILYTSLFIMGVGSMYSQVGIGTNDPNKSAQLELVSSDKGLLIPRIHLKSPGDSSTIVNGNVESLLVYNTSDSNNLTKGFYYWSGTKWEKVVDLTSLNAAISQSGLKGDSAFEVWKKQPGNANKTIVDYFASLKGEKGDPGTDAVHKGDVTGGEILTITPNAVTESKIAANAVTTAKITNGAVDNAKLDKVNIPLSGFGAAADDVALGDNKLTGVKDPTADQDAATKKYVDGELVTSKALTNGNIYVGDVSGKRAEVALSGDVTMTNAGAVTIAANAVTTGKILNANVTKEKIANGAVDNAKLDKVNIPLSGFGAAAGDVALGDNKLTGVKNPESDQDAATKKYVDDGLGTIKTLDDGKIYVGNNSNEATEVVLGGDVTMTNAGAVTIAANAVTTAKLNAGAVTTGKILNANVTKEKIANGAVDNAKLDKVNIPLSGFGAATGDVALGDNKLTGVKNPESDQDAATKKYVDGELVTSKALTNGNIYVGDVSGKRAEVALSGDVTMTNAGAVTIAANAVTTGKILNANVTKEKIANGAVDNAKLDKTNIPLSGFGAATGDVALGDNKLTGVKDPTLAQDAATKKYVDDGLGTIKTLDDGKIYVGNNSNEATEVVLGGDVTMTNAGAVTIAANAVTTAKLNAGAVTTGKILNANVTKEKIANGAVDNAKLDKVNIPLSGFGAAADDVALGNNKLTGVKNPESDQDAATKKYVDDGLGTIKTLDDGKIYVGNNSNEATEVVLGGDVTMTNAGAVTIAANAVTTGKILNANVTKEKIANGAVDNAKLDKVNIPLSGFGAAAGDVALGDNKLTGVKNPESDQDAATKKYVDDGLGTIKTLDDGKIYVGNNSNEATEVVLGGDVTMTNAGAVTIAANAVTTAKLNAGAVTTGKILNANVTKEKIANGAVDNAKLDKVNIPLSGFGAAADDVALGNNKLTGVKNPESDQDAATKKYVDDGLGTIKTLDDGKIYVGNNSNEATEVVLGGDVTMTNAGAVTIAANAVTTAKLNAGAVTTGKILNANVTKEKIANGAVDNAKLDKVNIPLSGFGAAAGDVALGDNKLTGVKNPESDQDAATKKYVDDGLGTIKTLDDGKIYVGNNSNEATEVALSGDVTMTNAGAVTIAANAVTTGKILNANVTKEKIANGAVDNAKLDKTNIPLSGFGAATGDVALGDNKLTGVKNPESDQDAATKKYVDDGLGTIKTLDDGKIYVGNNSNEATEVVLGGDVTMTNAGAVTIAANAVTTAKLNAGAVTTGKILNANVTKEKIANGAVDNAKLDKVNIPLSGFGAAAGDVALGDNKLTGVKNPESDQDAATKKYVDDGLGTIKTLDDGKIYVGNNSNEATEVVLGGDVTMTNAGAVTIAANAVTTAKLNAGAVTTGKILNANVTKEKIANGAVDNAKLDKVNIPLSGFGAATGDVALGDNKLTGVKNPESDQDAATKKYVDDGLGTIKTLDDGKIYVGNNSNEATEVVLGGDVTMTNAGAVTIAANAVTTAKLNTGAVTTGKILNANVTKEKIANGAVDNAKLDKVNIPLSGFGAAAGDVALGDNKLTGVKNPESDQDAATKKYVDDGLGTIKTLDDGKIYVGNNSNEATEVALSGDVTMTNAGAVTIAANAVTTGKILNANVTKEKIANGAVDNAKLDKVNIPLSGFGAAAGDVALGDNKLTGVKNPESDQDAATKKYVDDGLGTIKTLDDGKIYVGNNSNEATEVVLGGDVTMTNAGAVTIAANAVTTAKLNAGAVTTGKILNANVTKEKIANGAVDNAKLDKVNIPLSGFGAAAGDVALGDNKLTGVKNPESDQDAATKKYVDDGLGTIKTLDDGKIYVGNNSNEATEVVLGGDVTMTNAGAVTIAANAVTTAKLNAGAVTTGKILNANVTKEKIANGAVDNAKLDKVNIPLSGFGAAADDVALGNNKLTGVKNPESDQDAATKKYVDDLQNGRIRLGNSLGKAAAVQLNGDATMANDGKVTVSGIDGKTVDLSTAPTDGQVLKWNNTASKWVAGDDSSGVIPTTSQTANYTVLASQETVFISAASGDVTVTLPAAVNGKKVVVKKTDTSEVNKLIVQGASGANIDGEGSISTSVPYQGWVLQSDGANWFIIGHI